MSKGPNIRTSRFRHLFGEPFQLRDTYGDICPGSIHTESTVLKANGSFIGVPWEKEGSGKVGTVAEDTPLIYNSDEFGDPAQLNEFNFCPVDDHMLATAGNDGQLSVYRIPEGGLTEDISTPITKFQASDKRLLSVEWHNLASGVLLTASAGKEVKFYDVEAQSEQLQLPAVHKGLLTGFAWNSSGSMLLTCSKDKSTRVFDPRSQEVVAEIAQDHTGAKSVHPIWSFYNDKIVTAGFSRTNDRELHVYDPRNPTERLGTGKLDAGSSTIMLFQDEDLGVLFAAGKGDGVIKFFELDESAEAIHNVNEYRAKNPQNGLAVLPKTECDVKSCEILRFLKLSGKRIEPIRFEVPRANKNVFHEDLFPATWDRKPTTNSSGWFGGEDGLRGRIELRGN